MPRPIITALLLFLFVSTASVHGQATAPTLAAAAPEHYTVQAGDTLWAIAQRFLNEPWRWKEIWQNNAMTNPDRLYPGQILVLDKRGSVPLLKTGKRLSERSAAGDTLRLRPSIYEQESLAPIPAIPPGAIEPFLSEPRVVELEALISAPRIVATEEDRVYLGPGNLAYVSSLNDGTVRYWQVFRPATPIRNPGTGEILGHEAFYLGTVQLETPGRPALVRVTSAKREMGAGDFLMPAQPADIPIYAPHAPEAGIQGRVAAIYEGVGEAGRNSIITLNLGRTQGLEVGHVLALYRDGRTALYRNSDGAGKAQLVALPPERFGLVFVFRVFERIAYALVMNTSRSVNVGDGVRSPGTEKSAP